MAAVSRLFLALWVFSLLAGSASVAATFDFGARVRAHETIERFYQAQRLGAADALAEAVPRAVAEAKALRALRLTELLAQRWGIAVTEGMLEREMERIATDTRMPARLRGLYRALGDDPLTIRETLVRSILVERLARGHFARDGEIHADARERALELARTLREGTLSPDRPIAERTQIEWSQVEEAAGASSEPAALRRRMAERGALDALPLELSPAEFARQRARAPKRIGEVGEVIQTRDAFEFRVVLSEQPDRAIVAVYRVPKTSWDAWWSAERSRYDGSTVGVVASATAPLALPHAAGEADGLVDANCTPDDSWLSMTTGHDPAARRGHSAVWTGSEMIVFGDAQDSGVRYDPATDSWSPLSAAGAPSPRFDHSAVWTGSEMIVWGGAGPLGDGARYDPASDSWSPVTSIGAPEARSDHTAVWTGDEMIVFGGTDAADSSLASGGRYDPATDSWAALPFPSGGARHDHTAIWTGDLMVVWGGIRRGAISEIFLGTGARYDPARDRWTDTSDTNAPAARAFHSAIWTGSRMIVFGGSETVSNITGLLGDGASYNPQSNKWSAIDITGAPSARRHHAAVWTGSEMIVWGGEEAFNVALPTGGRYDPTADSWTGTSTTGVPQPAIEPTSVWTGSEMIVWGGDDKFLMETNTGGRYDPAADSWTPTALTTAEPPRRQNHTTVWTGSEMIVWGGSNYPDTFDNGGRYDPLLDVWLPTSLIGAPAARSQHMAAWAGGRMVVWGGFVSPDATDTGGRYDPLTDTWQATTVTGAPFPRFDATAVSTGDRMIVWGGDTDLQSPGELNSGGIYDPATDTWQTTSLSGVPSPRIDHTAVWTGSEMIVWGGGLDDCCSPPFDDGAIYSPVLDAWRPMEKRFLDASPVPGRREHTAVWTGGEMIVFGGSLPNTSGGARYDEAVNVWRTMSQDGAPFGRIDHSAVWTGSLMVVWGGRRQEGGSVFGVDGGRYDPLRDQWTPTAESGAPDERADHSGVWTGNAMIAWGGSATPVDPQGGGVYDPADFDLDGISDGCDCAPGDPGSSGLGEIGGLAFADDVTLSWVSGNPEFGPATVHDVLRGPLDDLPVGSTANETCLADGLAESSLTDAGLPGPAAGFWYLVRAANACGIGTYGSGASGERLTTTCP